MPHGRRSSAGARIRIESSTAKRQKK
jgi:hypothetical protein